MTLLAARGRIISRVELCVYAAAAAREGACCLWIASERKSRERTETKKAPARAARVFERRIDAYGERGGRGCVYTLRARDTQSLPPSESPDPLRVRLR